VKLDAHGGATYECSAKLTKATRATKLNTRGEATYERPANARGEVMLERA